MAHIDRFDNESLRLLLVKLVLKVVLVGRQHPRFGEEVKIVLESLLHAGEVPRQIVLPCQGLHAGLAVDPLMRSELADLLGLYADIGPIEVPVRRHVLVQLELHFAADSLDHIVPSRMRAQNEFLIRLFLRGCLRGARLSHIVLFIVGLHLSFLLLNCRGRVGSLPSQRLYVNRCRSLKCVFDFFDALGCVEIVPVLMVRGRAT